MIDYVAYVDGAYGAPKAAKLVVIRYDIRTGAKWWQQDPSPLTTTAVGISAGVDGGHLGNIHVLGGHLNDQAVGVDGYDLQSCQLAIGMGIDGVWHGIQLTLCLVTEEL